MTTTELKSLIKTASFDRCFVFCGDEDYLKQYYLKELRRGILTDDAFSVFNHFKFEGEKIDFRKLYESVSAPPMMTEYKLIEWHMANFDAMKEAELEAFADFCEARKDYPFSCVVFIVSGKYFTVGNLPKRPSHLYSTVSAITDTIIFDYSTDAQLVSWIMRHIEHEGLKSDNTVCHTLLEKCGRDMNTLNLEIDKLCAYAKANGKELITENDVAYVCCTGLDSDAFGLSNGILNKNKKQAYEALLDMKLKKTDPTVILGSLARLYGEIVTISELIGDGLSQSDISKRMKMHEYKVGIYMKYISRTPPSSIKSLLANCKEADSLIKSSSTNAYTVIERLIAENA